MEKVYQNLSKISVQDKVEKKGRFDYLSWAWAWHYLQSNYPNSTRRVYENPDGIPYFTDGKFANVKVGITINGVEHVDYLPVTDNLNRSIPITKMTSFDVNNAIQRSTAKAIAMHGLGLSLWIGEDTARLDDDKKSSKKMSGTFALQIGDGNWEKVLKFIVANKKQGLPWIIEKLSTKYKVTKVIEKQIAKIVKS